MMDPPIQTEYFLSGGAVIVTTIAAGTKALSSFAMRSSIPGYIVVPPESTMFSYKSLRTSTSVAIIELKVVKWMPGSVFPSGCVLKSDSGQRETLFTHGDNISIWELIGLLQVFIRLCHLCFKVDGDIGEPLFDITHDLLLGIRHKGVAAFCEELDHVLCHVPASQVQAEYSMWQCETLIDRHRVCDTITRVQHEARCPPGGIQGEHRLDLDVHLRHVEGLKHDLRHSLTI